VYHYIHSLYQIKKKSQLFFIFVQIVLQLENYKLRLFFHDNLLCFNNVRKNRDR